MFHYVSLATFAILYLHASLPISALIDRHTLPLHDALPISARVLRPARHPCPANPETPGGVRDRALRQEFLRSEEHTSELQSHSEHVCRLQLEKKKLQ